MKELVELGVWIWLLWLPLLIVVGAVLGIRILFKLAR